MSLLILNSIYFINQFPAPAAMILAAVVTKTARQLNNEIMCTLTLDLSSVVIII